MASLAPIIFVLLWSTGFIGAKYALPGIEPFTLLFVRFALALGMLLLVFVWLRPDFPRSWRQRFHLMASGLLVHGAYLGGVFTAIKLGMPAGVCAILVGLQPLLTAFVTPFLFRTRLTQLQWIGIVLGLLGIVMVLSNRLSLDGFGMDAILAAMVALCGITAGTLYQKVITVETSVLSTAFFQYCSTLLLFGALSMGFETREIHWDLQLFLALWWLVIGLSIGAILLLNYLIRNNEAYKVTSLFYLVPPLTVMESYLLFDEGMDAINIAGMVIVAISVYTVIKPRTDHPGQR